MRNPRPSLFPGFLLVLVLLQGCGGPGEKGPGPGELHRSFVEAVRTPAPELREERLRVLLGELDAGCGPPRVRDLLRLRVAMALEQTLASQGRAMEAAACRRDWERTARETLTRNPGLGELRACLAGALGGQRRFGAAWELLAAGAEVTPPESAGALAEAGRSLLNQERLASRRMEIADHRETYVALLKRLETRAAAGGPVPAREVLLAELASTQADLGRLEAARATRNRLAALEPGSVYLVRLDRLLRASGPTTPK